jgi:hypothetical protein
VANALSKTKGQTSATRTLTMTGANLDNVAAVYIGAVAASDLVVVSPAKITFRVGTAFNFQPMKYKVTLAALSTGERVPTPLTYQYVLQTKRDRQMDYAFDHWNDRSSKTYFYASGTNCANFTNQVLRARGWKPTSNWHNYGWTDYTSSWVSSTALMKYFKARPQLAAPLTDKQRNQVRVGDVVQFDWDGSGDRDHTAVVSKVSTDVYGHVSVYYVGHTSHTTYSSVDSSINPQHPKARVYYWHLVA